MRLVCEVSCFLFGSEVKGIKPYNLKTLPAKRPYNLTLVNEIRVVTNPLLVLMVLK